MISQIVAYAGIEILNLLNGGGLEAYYEQGILLTALAGLLTLPPCLWIYRRDHMTRVAGGLVKENSQCRLYPKHILLLLGMGAAFSQFANMLVGILQSVLHYEEYEETMEVLMAGKSMWFLILCMGVIAPFAEEVVFRWLIYLRLRDHMRVGRAAIISGAIFGIYHGNLVQAVYAGLLGAIFAWILECSGNLWSSVLLHVGANIWSLVSTDIYTWMLEDHPGYIITLLGVLVMILYYGVSYFRCKESEQCKRFV